MNKTIQEVIVENKPVVLVKKEFFSEKEINNTIEPTSISDELNQIEKFKTYIPSNYFNSTSTDEYKELTTKKIYLNCYKNHIWHYHRL